MSLSPLLEAPWQIQIHAFAAMGAFLIGLVQIFGVKGTWPHRILGTVWIVLMLVVTATAAIIWRPTKPGDPFMARFSWIHLFIPLTAFFLAAGTIRLVRGGADFKRHGSSFRGIFVGALLITGAFTFFPGRIMHAVVTGGESGNTEGYEPFRLGGE